MKKIQFKIEQVVGGRVVDAAYVDEGESPLAAVIAQAWQDLSTDVEITISGVTMHAAAWEDPDHWLTDWAEKLEIDRDEVPEAVLSLIAQATEE